MEHLDFPDKTLWNNRYKWFNNLLEERQGLGSYFICDHASALLSEMQAVYCCGAWYSVIILAVSIIDAQFREYELPDHKGNTFELAKELNFNPEFDWLRKKRNKLVHINVDAPAAAMDDYWSKKSELKADAEKALVIICDALFLSPGT